MFHPRALQLCVPLVIALCQAAGDHNEGCTGDSGCGAVDVTCSGSTAAEVVSVLEQGSVPAF